MLIVCGAWPQLRGLLLDLEELADLLDSVFRKLGLRILSFLQQLARAGDVNSRRAANAIATFDEVRAMTWRFLNP